MKSTILCTLFLSLFLSALGIDLTPIKGGKSGDGITTRYWDCCAPSCAWDHIIHTKNGVPVQTCKADGVTPSTSADNAQSGCQQGGVAYTCNNQQPRTVNSSLAFAFVAASFEGGTDYNDCCICLVMDFKDELAGKRLIAQVTNTGSDLQENHFDILLPGGGVGIFQLGCETQWNTPADGWGQRYGGVTTEEECNELPAVLQDGCKWRWTFMNGVPNPNVSFYQIKCPTELVSISKCGDL